MNGSLHLLADTMQTVIHGMEQIARNIASNTETFLAALQLHGDGRRPSASNTQPEDPVHIPATPEQADEPLCSPTEIKQLCRSGLPRAFNVKNLQKILESQTVQVAKKNLLVQHWKNVIEVQDVFRESLACSMQEDTTHRSDATS